MSALLSNASARTLILGIDKAGRVIQHDRNAADILAFPRDALLGAEISSLLADPAAHAATLDSLLSAALSDRESTAVLTLLTGPESTSTRWSRCSPCGPTTPIWPRWPCCASRRHPRDGSSTPR